MSKFQGERFVDRFNVKIAAKPEVVFPLLCPEREKEWIDGWSYEMIYSESGLAELGCVFKTNNPEEGEAYWVMAKHVPNTEAEYIHFVPGLLIYIFSMRLSERDNDTTAINVTHTVTGLSEQGNQLLAQQIPVLKQNGSWLENTLNQFIQNGVGTRLFMNENTPDLV